MQNAVKTASRFEEMKLENQKLFVRKYDILFDDIFIGFNAFKYFHAIDKQIEINIKIVLSNKKSYSIIFNFLVDKNLSISKILSRIYIINKYFVQRFSK